MILVIFQLRDQKTLVSGSHDGQVFLWSVETGGGGDEGGGGDKWTMVPRHVLLGHTAAVRSVALARCY